jgi:hypothetical protein
MGAAAGAGMACIGMGIPGGKPGGMNGGAPYMGGHAPGGGQPGFIVLPHPSAPLVDLGEHFCAAIRRHPAPPPVALLPITCFHLSPPA